jgi:phage shock protein A
MWVAVSERGFTSTFKETGAMAKFLAHHANESQSQLCRELAATRGSGWKVSSSAEELRQGTLAALQQAVQLLASKGEESIADYRELVVSLAHEVSSAAAGGEQVEARVIEEISQALTV